MRATVSAMPAAPAGMRRDESLIWRAQVELMRAAGLAYEAVGGEEYQALKPELVRVAESQGSFAFAADIKQPTSRDAFFKVAVIACCACPSTSHARHLPSLAHSTALLHAAWLSVSCQIDF